MLLSNLFDFNFYRLGYHDKFGKTMSGNGDCSELAFAVGELSEDFDPMIPPATGAEYIQRVV
jgi:hypothetical protein